MDIPFHRPDLGEAEEQAVLRVLRDGRIGGNGLVCARVEHALAELTGAAFVLLTPSATHAMEVALAGMEIGPGDDVLMPSFAFVSLANAVIARGARPVFCEVDERTLDLDVEDAASRASARTRLVAPVHYAGVACDMDALGALARERGWLVFEDAAQAIGARWRGRHLGTLGDAGCLSFHVTKNAVAGEGGALLTSDPALAQRARVIQEKGTDRHAFLRGEVARYTWVGTGGSYVLSDLLAALLEVQLARLEELQARRMARWNHYHEALAELEHEGFLRRPCVPAGASHNAHLYALRMRDAALRERVLERLGAAGIGATFHFQPLHSSPYARAVLGLEPGLLPRTEEIAATLVRLPLYSALAPEAVERVVQTLAGICRAS